ncbi:heparan-alpha-glucosaminide N-acetyltransferase domain-containing protein [Agromyces archimandritae]|uniref:DUF1624 domain-containing protein n=1 Tax=Agromyces archimandritae TaxID=2781962 RepID=A0A975FLI5_9MICO|nr:heparan-alpha-glucosaminide N-acetyltransferase domain-containing protein [Agromyces archimandritae]QTX03658.1 DUF1624 domain-containing protein [Agromyces archimandritae]
MQQAAPRARITGIDAARGLALLGMFVAHVVPDGDGAAGDALFAIATERSRLLFAITAGFGLGLLTGGTRPAPPGERRGLRRQIAVRALLLLALGLLLTAMGPLVYVILDEYGIAFAIMIALVFLPARVLLAVGAPLVVLMAGLTAWGPLRAALGIGPDHLLADWFATGAYPVLVWVPVMMVGVGIVRLGIDRPRVLAWVGSAGLAVAIAGLGVSVALGGDLLAPTRAPGADAVGAACFTAGNVGVGLATSAALIALTARTPAPVARVAGGMLSPLAAAGSMPLTVYTVQLVVLRATTRVGADGIPTDDSWATFWWLTVGTLIGAWLWRRHVGRGPLEWVVAVASGRIRFGGA